MADDQNSIPELLELLLRTSAAGGKKKEIPIRADLRVSKAEIEGPDAFCFTVSLKRVWLSMDTTGLTILPDTRYGEPVKNNEIMSRHHIRDESTTHAQMSGGAGLSISSVHGGIDPHIDLSIKAKAATEGKTTASTTLAESVKYYRVKARGALSWEVTESPSLGDLDGTYLKNEILCIASTIPGSNARRVELQANVKQKDLNLQVTHKDSLFRPKSKNHEKMLKLLIAKALSSSASTYGGYITFSNSGADIED